MLVAVGKRVKSPSFRKAAAIRFDLGERKDAWHRNRLHAETLRREWLGLKLVGPGAEGCNDLAFAVALATAQAKKSVWLPVGKPRTEAPLAAGTAANSNLNRDR